MRTSTFIAPLFFAASSLAQAVEEGIAPDAATPKGCETTVATPFRIGTLENPSLKRRESAQEASDGDLLCTLEDGILHDQYGRTGSVVANRQFQFDGPPQAGAIYTGGFSVCGNDSLAIGGSTRWWRCMSGAFGNLYDEWIGAQCHEIRIQAIFDESSSSASSASSSMSKTESVASTTSSSALVGSTSIISASKTSGLHSESRSMHHTSGASSTSAEPTATDSSAVSGSSSDAAAATGEADAPPAEGAAASLSAAPLAIFGVSAIFLGAALML